VGLGSHITIKQLYDFSGEADCRDNTVIYDGVGRLLSQTTDDNRITQFRYDENGNVTQIAPPGRPGHLMEYDAIDLLTVYDPPVAFTGPRQTFYQYDLDQSLTNVVRPDGLQISYQMDSVRRLERIVSPEGTITLHYDNPDCGCSGDSKPTRIDGFNGQSLQFKYDGSLLTNSILTGEVAGSISVQFDNNFRVRKQWLNFGSVIDFNYDNDGLLTQAGDLTLVRNAANGVLEQTILGTVRDSLVLSGFGEITNYAARVGSSPPFFNVNYLRDKAGRITTKIETVGTQTTVFDYGYDRAGRLTNVVRNGISISDYGYDLNGNRTRSVLDGVEKAYLHDDQDRLLEVAGSAPEIPTTFEYTANGELFKKRDATGETTYQYDVFGPRQQNLWVESGSGNRPRL